MATLSETMDKYRRGDPITDAELEEAIAAFKTLSDITESLPDFALAFREAHRTLESLRAIRFNRQQSRGRSREGVKEYREWLRDQESQGLMSTSEMEYQLKRVACCCVKHGKCPDCPEHGVAGQYPIMTDKAIIQAGRKKAFP